MLLASTFAGRVSQVLAHAVLARAVGATEFGLYALGWSILQFGQAIGHLGLSEGVVRYVPRHGGARVRSILVRALGISGMAGCALAGMLAISAEPLARLIFAKPDLAPVLLCLAPGLAVAPMMQVAAAATRASGVMRYSVLTVEAGLPVLLMVGALAVWWFGGSPIAMALFTSMIMVLIALSAVSQVAWIYCQDFRSSRKSGPEPDRLLPFSLFALSLSMTLLLMLWSDRLFVGAFRPAAEVGYYYAASQFSMLVVIVFGPLGAALAPIAAAAAWDDRRDDLKHAYQNLYRWGLYLALPSVVVALEFADLIVPLVYGPGFIAAVLPARILFAGQFFYFVGGGAGALLVMTGHERLWLLHSSCAVLVNLVLNALIVPHYGMPGAAIATVLAFGLLQGGGCLLVRRQLGLWPLNWPHGIALLATVLSFALAATMIHAGEPTAGLLARSVPPLAACFALAAVVVGFGTRREDFALLRWRFGWRTRDRQ